MYKTFFSNLRQTLHLYLIAIIKLPDFLTNKNRPAYNTWTGRYPRWFYIHNGYRHFTSRNNISGETFHLLENQPSADVYVRTYII